MTTYIVSIARQDAQTFTLTTRQLWEDPPAPKPLAKPKPVQPYRFCTITLRMGSYSPWLAEFQQRYTRRDHRGHAYAAHGFPTLANHFPERIGIRVHYKGTVAELDSVPQDLWPVEHIELLQEEAVLSTSFEWWTGERVEHLTLRHLELQQVEGLDRRAQALVNLNLSKAKDIILEETT